MKKEEKEQKVIFDFAILFLMWGDAFSTNTAFYHTHGWKIWYTCTTLLYP